MSGLLWGETCGPVRLEMGWAKLCCPADYTTIEQLVFSYARSSNKPTVKVRFYVSRKAGGGFMSCRLLNFYIRRIMARQFILKCHIQTLAAAMVGTLWCLRNYKSEPRNFFTDYLRKVEEISVVLEDGGWGRHMGIRCYENREKNNKEKNLELLKLHMDGDDPLNSQAILTTNQRHLRCIKIMDGGLQHVMVKCSGLKNLNLYALSSFTDEAYKKVSLLAHLEFLDLCGTQVGVAIEIVEVAWYLDDGTIVGDTLVVGKVLDLITEDGPRCGLHLNVDKTELFWPKEDPRSRLEGVFPPNISRPLHGVKLLGGPVSVDADFSSALVLKRVSKTIGLLNAVAKINDPQCELLLIRACAGVSKLYFAMRTCPPRVFESAQLSFDIALRSALERIVTASGSGFGDWQWRLATLPFAFGGLGIYSAGDVLNYAFIASRLQSDTLQTKLLRHVGIIASGSTFDEALCVFNNAMKIDFL
ncbi:hypothetical protein Tco_0257233, partial [Tanacetum coccineum]